MGLGAASAGLHLDDGIAAVVLADEGSHHGATALQRLLGVVSSLLGVLGGCGAGGVGQVPHGDRGSRAAEPAGCAGGISACRPGGRARPASGATCPCRCAGGSVAGPRSWNADNIWVSFMFDRF